MTRRVGGRLGVDVPDNGGFPVYLERDADGEICRVTVRIDTEDDDDDD